MAQAAETNTTRRNFIRGVVAAIPMAAVVAMPALAQPEASAISTDWWSLVDAVDDAQFSLFEADDDLRLGRVALKHWDAENPYPDEGRRDESYIEGRTRKIREVNFSEINKRRDAALEEIARCKQVLIDTRPISMGDLALKAKVAGSLRDPLVTHSLIGDILALTGTA